MLAPLLPCCFARIVTAMERRASLVDAGASHNSKLVKHRVLSLLKRPGIEEVVHFKTHHFSI